MAIVAKTNIELDDLLREKPTTVIYPPEPVEEQPVQNPIQTMESERLTRYNQAVAKRKNDCNLIDRTGVSGGNKPRDIADKRAKFMVYLTIRIEGRRMHARKYPQTNVENITNSNCRKNWSGRSNEHETSHLTVTYCSQDANEKEKPCNNSILL